MQYFVENKCKMRGIILYNMRHPTIKLDKYNCRVYLILMVLVVRLSCIVYLYCSVVDFSLGFRLMYSVHCTQINKKNKNNKTPVL